MTQALIVAMLVLPGLMPAQSFPSDGKSPAEANGAELLQAVRPGKVKVGKEITCDVDCPSYTEFRGFGLFDWALARVTRGHFLSPTSEDAVLSIVGCESHPNNLGGTILLTRRLPEVENGVVQSWHRDAAVPQGCAPGRAGDPRLIGRLDRDRG